MHAELIVPEWPVAQGVRGLVTTRALGDMKLAECRLQLRALLPAEPVWLRQVHGTGVVDAARAAAGTAADACFSRERNTVCAVTVEIGRASCRERVCQYV